MAARASPDGVLFESAVWIIQTEGKGAFDQPGVNDHAAFMNALANEGIVLFAGPLADSERGRIRALVIVNASSEADIVKRLAADPWASTTARHYQRRAPWNLFLGADRMSTA